MIPIFNYADIPGVRQVPVVADASSVARQEFIRDFSNSPVIFRNLARNSDAVRQWREGFLTTYLARDMGKRVEVRFKGHIATREYDATAAVPLEEFILAVGNAKSLYLSQWYLFKRYPELVEAILSCLPEYLLDDWLEGIPKNWLPSLESASRTNIYWGADLASTPCHYDSYDSITWNMTIKGTKRWLLFSSRAFAFPELNNIDRSWQRTLSARGFLIDGFVTPDVIRAHLQNPIEDIPPLDFYAADVSEGDLIYVPWKWAHQVQNIGESLAISRYYVGEENHTAFCDYFRRNFGTMAGVLAHALVRSKYARSRGGWPNAVVYRLLNTAIVTKLFHLVFPPTYDPGPFMDS